MSTLNSSSASGTSNEGPVELGVDYFLLKLSSIPEEDWVIGDLRGKTVLEHCGCIHGVLAMSNEACELSRLLGYQASAINDGIHPSYKQPTPKQRVIAALRDIKTK